MKRLVLLLSVSCASLACSGGFDAKRQVDSLDSRIGPRRSDDAAAKVDTPDAARNELVAMPFVMVPVATDVDPFPRKPKVSVPPDSKVLHSVQIKAYGSGDRAMRYQTHGLAVQTPLSWERFDREIAPLVSDAAALPAGTALLFEWTTNGGGAGIGAWDALPVRLPVLATAHDIAGARPDQHETRRPNPDGKTFRTVVAQAVRVSLTPDAATRLTRWDAEKKGLPVASAVKGRVMDVSVLGNATTVYLDVEWLPEEERRSAAEALAAELRAAAGR